VDNFNNSLIESGKIQKRGCVLWPCGTWTPSTAHVIKSAKAESIFKNEDTDMLWNHRHKQ